MRQKLFPRRRSLVSTVAMLGLLFGMLLLDRVAQAQSNGGGDDGGKVVAAFVPYDPPGIDPFDPLDQGLVFDPCDSTLEVDDEDGSPIDLVVIVIETGGSCSDSTSSKEANAGDSAQPVLAADEVPPPPAPSGWYWDTVKREVFRIRNPSVWRVNPDGTRTLIFRVGDFIVYRDVIPRRWTLERWYPSATPPPADFPRVWPRPSGI